MRGILLILRTRRTLPSFSGVGNASDLDESSGLLPFNLRPLAKRSSVGGKEVCAWTNPLSNEVKVLRVLIPLLYAI